MDDDIDILWKFCNLLMSDSTLGVLNSSELSDAKHALAVMRGDSDENLPLPEDFPVPRLGLPDNDFAPDFFHFGNYHFCSERFREAICQPGAVVQYRPIELTSGGSDVLARNYRWFRILASQAAMDMQLSVCSVERITSQISGKTIAIAENIERFALPANFAPATDIFRVAETLVDKMVTDALAVRVLRAGCTGMEFRHPEDKHSGEHIVHFRTIDGVGERRVGFLD